MDKRQLKATYLDHVDATRCAPTWALLWVKEAQRKYTELQKAFEQPEAKRQVLEKLALAQKQWELQQKHLQSLTEISEEVKGGQKKALEKLDRSHQELEPLKQQAGQAQEKLQWNQAYIQLLCTLQNKLVISEAKVKDKDVTGQLALPPRSP